MNNIKDKNGDNMLKWNKHRLTAPIHVKGTKEPTLELGMYDNNPRFLVKTGVEGDDNYGTIEGKIDLFVLGQIFAAIKDVALDENSKGYKFANQTTFMNGKKYDKPLTESWIIVSRDEDGVFIALLAYKPDRPAIKFHFGSRQFHPVVDARGNEISKIKFSALSAISYARIMENMFITALNSEYIPWSAIDQRKKKNSNNGGGNRNRGGNGNGYSGNNNYNNGGNRNNNNSAPAPQSPAVDDFSDWIN